MRLLVRFEREEPAAVLGDALYVEGIENRVEQARQGGFHLWVHDETQMEAARRLLELFEHDPQGDRFQEARTTAAARRRQAERKESSERRRSVRVREQWAPSQTGTPLTWTLIGISVAVALGSSTAGRSLLLEDLLFATRGWGSTDSPAFLFDLRAGEVWRLVTPIFVHFGVIHLLFNMYMLHYLAGLVERRESWLYLLAFVLATAVLSNLGEYLLGHWRFGGMSGVNYGLFGYLWIRGRQDPSFGYALSRSTVVVLLGWFVLCFTGLMGNVANGAHAVGLVVGALWGYLRGKVARGRP